jgi:hypothetical protein
MDGGAVAQPVDVDVEAASKLPDAPIPRREYIALIMEQQGLHGNPSKYIVLRHWDTIVDHDRDYEVRQPELPANAVGCDLYAMVTPDSPALTLCSVVECYQDGWLLVEPDLDYKVRLRVHREDTRTCPIPFKPLAIRRRDIAKFIGNDAAKTWSDQRRNRKSNSD